MEQGDGWGEMGLVYTGECKKDSAWEALVENPRGKRKVCAKDLRLLGGEI